PHFFHKNFPGIPRSDAQFMLKSTSRNTRKASLHNKTGDATMPLVRGGFREDQKVIGHIAEGDPGFASIENVVVSVTNSRGLDGSHVGAGVWLGQSIGSHFAPLCLRSQIFFFLKFISPL